MNGIGWAVKQMHNELKVHRAGWNGKGMYIYLVAGVGRELPFVMMSTVTGHQVPWLCSQTDLLAIDWEIAI